MSLTVLIADDDQLSRLMLERLVTTWEHRFVSAGDGQSACEILQKEKIDVCILDWQMPKVSGIEVCRWIYSAMPDAIPHLMLLTSKGRLEDIDAGYAAGANDFMTKPLSPEYLKLRLATVARRRAQLSESPNLSNVDVAFVTRLLNDTMPTYHAR